MDSNIRVAVRVRPLQPTEHLAASAPNTEDRRQSVLIPAAPRKSISIVDENVIIFDPTVANRHFQRGVPTHENKRTKDLQYYFDRVLDERADQADVYGHTVRPLLDGVLDGFNATVFAYGATGSGKTFTISGTKEHPGIMPLAMSDLFERIDKATDKIIQVSVSYLEVYNETIRDLLASDGSMTQSLDLREDGANRIVVAGLSEHFPTSGDKVMALVEKGTLNRTKSATKANEDSSRSHAVFQIHIQQRDRVSGTSTQVQSATLTLCDLAGSERASATENRGQQLREGANINRSLLALGNCINALCDESKKPQHIPYRDSKLTRLLKYSLGGNCRTVMIANISPAMIHYEETHNTLKYAARAKQIRLKVERNTVDVEFHVSQYVEIIEQLRREVAYYKSQAPDAVDAGADRQTLETAVKSMKETMAEIGRVKACIVERELAIAFLTRQNAVVGTIAENDVQILDSERQLGEHRARIESLERKVVECMQAVTALPAVLSAEYLQQEQAARKENELTIQTARSTLLELQLTQLFDATFSILSNAATTLSASTESTTKRQEMEEEEATASSTQHAALLSNKMEPVVVIESRRSSRRQSLLPQPGFSRRQSTGPLTMPKATPRKIASPKGKRRQSLLPVLTSSKKPPPMPPASMRRPPIMTQRTTRQSTRINEDAPGSAEKRRRDDDQQMTKRKAAKSLPEADGLSTESLASDLDNVSAMLDAMSPQKIQNVSPKHSDPGLPSVDPSENLKSGLNLASGLSALSSAVSNPFSISNLSKKIYDYVGLTSAGTPSTPKKKANVVASKEGLRRLVESEAVASPKIGAVPCSPAAKRLQNKRR